MQVFIFLVENSAKIQKIIKNPQNSKKNEQNSQNSKKFKQNFQKNHQKFFQKIQKVLQFSTFNPNFHFFTKQITKQKCWKIIF